MSPKRVLILHAPGTNRDGDLAHAFIAAGGVPEIAPLSRLVRQAIDWLDFDLLALPGGFSYGDALGAGRLWALELHTTFSEQLARFVASGRPVIGICNGFQALVKSGVLPSPTPPASDELKSAGSATLTFNASGRFECRWVTLAPNHANLSPWLQALPPILCPVAHGEGRFMTADGCEIPVGQVALTYARRDLSSARGAYPANPNGSVGDIAGITNPAGNVLGLMPHPEDHIHPYQHPRWTRGERGFMGLQLFENGLKNFKGL